MNREPQPVPPPEGDGCARWIIIAFAIIAITVIVWIGVKTMQI